MVASPSSSLALVQPPPRASSSGALRSTKSDAHFSVVTRYLFSIWFCVDFISCVPSQLMPSDTSFFKGLRLFRLARIGKILKRFDDLMFASAFRLARLLIFISYNIHWSACIWNLTFSDDFAIYFKVAKECSECLACELDPTSEDCDACCDGGSRITMIDRILPVYTICVWCSCSFLLGLGAVNPFSVAETYVASALSIYGACVQACVFGSVAVLIAGLDAEEAQFQRKITEVATRLRHMSIPDVLRKRIISYYTMLWELNRSGSTNIDSFVGELSPSLQSEIRICLFRDMVVKVRVE